MKLRKSGRALLATATTLGLGLGLTSCSPSNTIDYVYVTASKANLARSACTESTLNRVHLPRFRTRLILRAEEIQWVRSRRLTANIST